MGSLSLKQMFHFTFLLCFITLLFVYNYSEQRLSLLTDTSYLYTLNVEIEILHNLSKVNVKAGKNPILILAYTSFFGVKPWPVFKNLTCNFDTSNFKISHDENDFYKSDVVIFHGPNMPSLSKLQRIQSNRKFGQLWIYFSMEPIPKNANIEEFSVFFNIVSTYAINSDIRIPYRYHAKKNNSEKKTFKIDNFSHKNKMVAWFVSNCNGKERSKLVQKLRLYGIDFEVSGICSKYYSKTFKSSCQKRPCYNDLKYFKFYFSAENRLCEDYITEKYWETLNNDVIPIVLGGSNYSDPRLAIPGSFIDAMSFDSPKALANHILSVSTNQSKYNAYFEWKNSWKLDTNSYYCSLCQKFKQGITLTKNNLIKTMNIQKCWTPTTKFFSWIKK
ncbi:alpha-(1,3)-fucosyltransferase fut-6 isoform X2 [Hydra vulgaris]|uniref:Fucosyltransferase n=1 Tax=Hydra vulgaris TaxID=6087 RepID=A0ABM4BL72_HYDVU